MAEAHLKDLEFQARHSCETLTYWYDHDRGTAFCLIKAPSAGAVRGLHQDAHGLLPSEIIEVDPSMVAQFLGRVADPRTADQEPIEESAFRAIVFVEMVDSTDITKALGDSEALGPVRKYRDLVREALADHGGTEVDRAGDGFLISFASAHAAVACGISIQCALSREDTERDDGVPLEARVGIGAGEPVLDGDALFGSTII